MSLWRRVLTERRRVVVPLLALLVINIAVLGLAVLPLQRLVAGDEDRATTAALALTDARRQERLAQQARTSKEQADQGLKTFYSDVLPVGRSGAREVLYFRLGQLASDAGLHLDNRSFDVEDVDLSGEGERRVASNLQKMKGEAVLSGEYQNIKELLYALETAEEFFVVEKVSVGQAGRVQGGGGGSLEVTLNVATYFVAGAR